MSGFLPYHATFMLDFVLVALFLVIPILIFGLIQAHKKNYLLHAKTMIFLVALKRRSPQPQMEEYRFS